MRSLRPWPSCLVTPSEARRGSGGCRAVWEPLAKVLTPAQAEIGQGSETLSASHTVPAALCAAFAFGELVEGL